MLNDYEDEEPTRVTRLETGFALRDLIAGAEFSIREDDTIDDDDEESEHLSCYPDELDEKYQNYDALDLDCNETGVVSFSELRQKMTDLTSDGKVKKLLKRKGHGGLVTPNAVVYIHYNAHHDLEAKPFDNSYLRRKTPERHRLGEGNLIQGLEIAIMSMRLGEQSQFLFEPEYAFGARGCAPRIPPNATVLYEVELINFVDCVKDNIEEPLNDEDRKSFAYVEKVAMHNHMLGNDLFKQTNFKAAAKRYERAVEFLLGCRLSNDEEEAKRNKLLLKLYSNLTVVYNKIGRPKCVCRVCRDAIYVDGVTARKNAKLFYHWGVALQSLMEYDLAAEKLKYALKLEPNNNKIHHELSMLEGRKSQFAVEEKIYFQKALGMDPKTEKKAPMIIDSNNVTASEELKDMLKKKIMEVQNGKSVTLNVTQEVIENVEQYCNDLITDDLIVKRLESSLVISKAEKK